MVVIGETAVSWMEEQVLEINRAISIVAESFFPLSMTWIFT